MLFANNQVAVRTREEKFRISVHLLHQVCKTHNLKISFKETKTLEFLCCINPRNFVTSLNLSQVRDWLLCPLVYVAILITWNKFSYSYNISYSIFIDHKFIPVSKLLFMKYYIVTIYGCDYRRGLNWWMYLLTTYTHHSKPQVIAALWLISTLYKSPQHPLSLYPACCVISRSLVTASKSGDSSTSRALVLSSQPPMQNSTLNCQLTTNWVAPVFFKVTLRHGLHRKYPRFHCFSPTVPPA
jgi:hypothetical protein